jgi:hypothetical protein
LAIRTGIAPSVWAAEGDRAIMTAIALLNGDDGEREQTGRNGGRQMSG